MCSKELAETLNGISIDSVLTVAILINMKKKPADRVNKQKSNYLAIGLALGICLGALAGLTVFDNLAVGMGFGIALGMSFGVAFGNSSDKK